MLKMHARIWMIRDCVENELNFKCQRVAKTSTEISNVLAVFDIAVSVAKSPHPVAIDRDHETVAIHEADHVVDHAVADHVVVVVEIVMMVGVHFTTNQPIRSMEPHRRQNGVLRSIIFLHDAVGKI